MEILLESPNRRRLLLLAAVAIAALLIVQSGRVWLASERIDSGQLALIEMGAQLLPGNAEAWDRLGRFRQWDFANPDPAQAAIDYQRAVGEEPLSPYYWLDLAGAYEQLGDLAQSSEAFGRAKADYPLSAEVAWQYGNFLLRHQESSAGMNEIQRAVAADARILPLALSRVWIATRDVSVLLRVLPPNSTAYFKALEFFQSIHDPDSGLIVWNRLLWLGQPFPLKSAQPFLDELIRDDRSTDAQRAWIEALKVSGTPRAESSDGSLIWDGGFTQPFSNGGLGWYWDAPVGVAIDFDAPRIPNGTRSIRLDFGGGTNTDLDAPFQFVPVEPNHRYHFRAYLRTEQLTTESGPRFSIVDPHHGGAVNIATDNLTGTNPWTPADADVTTGPETHFLLVRVVRYQSRLFENKLAGTAWIADVSLFPSDAEPQADAENKARYR